MYHKIKNTLAGLGMVAVFLAGGLFFSEPVPATGEPADAPAPIQVAEASRDDALAVVTARGTHLRVHLAMPYYSFGGKLPRQES